MTDRRGDDLDIHSQPALRHGGGYVPGSSLPETSALRHDTNAGRPETYEERTTSETEVRRRPPPNPLHRSAYETSGSSLGQGSRTQCDSNEGRIEGKSSVDVPSLPGEEPSHTVKNQIHFTQMKNYSNVSAHAHNFRAVKPHLYLLPKWNYDTDQIRRHRDALNREFYGIPDDRYLSPHSGRLKKLIVQTTDDGYGLKGNTTYARTFVRNISPKLIRMGLWVSGHDGPKDNIALTALKVLPVALANTIMLMVPTNVSGSERNGGRYDGFAYRHYQYAKAPRNAHESSVQVVHAEKAVPRVNPTTKRVLLPRYLCFIGANGQITIQNVEYWPDQHPGETLDYLFVAYTAAQFQNNAEDLEALHGIAQRAAKDAGLSAYWVGCSCMPDYSQMEQDVYRISDIIRGAHSLVIAVGPSSGASNASGMLKQWGTRMWTYPEVLLSPGESIKVYNRSGNGPQTILKRQFASTAWGDAAASRQLIDHYEGSLLLSRLELVTLALLCLYSRDTTEEYLPGDHSYALMGLLRLRPTIDRTDSAFQAFARLSLANDSDMLLERLICTLPKTPTQHWSNMSDAWDAQLWDIYPTCQIAGVSHDDTIIIDGLRAASVRWKSFARVTSLTRNTWKRLLLQILLHTAPLFFWTGVTFSASMGGTLRFSPSAQGIAAALFLIALPVLLASPWIIKRVYGGKFWRTQPWLFGFEGHLPLDAIERQIFGASLGRLRWTPYASPLSRHVRNSHDECVGVDPVSDPKVAGLVAAARAAAPGGQRVFTIVDTGTMRVTLIQAARPPVALLVAGTEGGMQRAIGVSYEWETGTCYRETVMRIETPSAKKMDFVPRLRLGLTRKMMKVREAK